MPDVSIFRLNLLRAMYLLVAVGLGLTIWPLLVRSGTDAEHMRGVVWSLLAGVSVLAALGLKYPLRMLPVLLFELVWKVIWIGAIGIPLWSGGRLEGGMRETFYECLMGLVIVPLVVPWRYVLDQYVKEPADRWRGGKASEPAGTAKR